MNWKKIRGKKFERKKVRIAEKVEVFSARTFFLYFVSVHIEAVVLHKWQTTHFKACSKWLRMVKSNMLIYLKYEQKHLPKDSCLNFFPDPIFAVRFGIKGKLNRAVINLSLRTVEWWVSNFELISWLVCWKGMTWLT